MRRVSIELHYTTGIRHREHRELELPCPVPANLTLPFLLAGNLHHHHTSTPAHTPTPALYEFLHDRSLEPPI